MPHPFLRRKPERLPVNSLPLGPSVLRLYKVDPRMNDVSLEDQHSTRYASKNEFTHLANATI